VAETREEAAIAAFVRQIELRPVGEHRFQAEPSSSSGSGRIFGGQTLAQMVVAAGRTVTDTAIHSLHAYFLRPGKPDLPVIYEVHRIRDGRAFATRRVSALQGETLIFEGAVSFVRPEEGISHQSPWRPTPLPEALEDVIARREESVRRWGSLPAFDMVEDRNSQTKSGGTALPHQRIWWRPVAPLPEDPVIHAAAMAWMTDNNLFATVFRHYGLPPGTTLDHAIWWRHPPRFEGWHLRVSDSPAANAARALMLSSVYASNGTLVASVGQEGLFRGA